MTIKFKKSEKSQHIIISGCSVVKSDYKKGVLHLKLGFRSPDIPNRLNDEFNLCNYIVYRENDGEYYYVVIAQTEDNVFEITI